LNWVALLSVLRECVRSLAAWDVRSRLDLGSQSMSGTCNDAAQTLLQKTFRPYARSIHNAIRSTKITGLVIAMGLVGCVRVPWQTGHVTATLWLPRDDDLPDEYSLVRRIVLALRPPSERATP